MRGSVEKIKPIKYPYFATFGSKSVVLVIDADNIVGLLNVYGEAYNARSGSVSTNLNRETHPDFAWDYLTPITDSVITFEV